MMKIAAFGFREIPPGDGSAGADKFAVELYTRIVQKGYKVTAYNRAYSAQKSIKNYKGIELVSLKTVKKKGFDTLLHSFKCTLHIIFFNTGNVVHIHNGGNSIWGIFLRLFGKKVFISQDGVDWNRAKWPWYGKLFLYVSSFFTAYIPNGVIFDNVFAKELFETKFNRSFNFIPYGSEVQIEKKDKEILSKLNLEPNSYFLFVGRFIPDKGIHYLVKAFEQLEIDKKLILVGGSPNPSDYENSIKSTKDNRIIFPGYVYGNDTNVLIDNAFCYIQPSDVEGLSPLILTVMGIGTPLICSDIKENKFIAQEFATYFIKGDVNSLREKLEFVIANYSVVQNLAEHGKKHVLENYCWETVTQQHINLFQKQ